MRTSSGWGRLGWAAAALLLGLAFGGCGDGYTVGAPGATWGSDDDSGVPTPVASAGVQGRTGRVVEVDLETGQSEVAVVLDGSLSAVSGGSIVSFTWTGSPDPADVARPTVALSAGTYVFTLVVTDNRGTRSEPSSVTVTVNRPETPGNDPPIANAGPDRTITLAVGQTESAVELDGSGSRDPDGSVASYAWTGSPTPQAVARPTVTLGAGEHTFTLVVTDDDGASSAPDAVTITVTAAPPPTTHAPRLAVGASFSVREGDTLTVPVSADDEDGDAVSLSAGGRIANSAFRATAGTGSASGTFTFTPTTGQRGLQTVSFRARDTLGLQDVKSVQIDVEAVNQPPALTAPDTFTLDEGKLAGLTVQASDPDGDPVRLSASGLPPNALFVPATGSLTFAPDYSQAGTYEVTVRASDGQAEVSRVVRITVNDVVAGGPDQPRDLVLTVDPAESPSLLGKVRITGRVNASSDLPPPQRLTAVLVEGLDPASAQQGQTLDVTLTGSSLAAYATHFADGVTSADFGPGVRVNSVRVTGPGSAVASVTVGAAASPGPRPVTATTGNETALSIVAFAVGTGRAQIAGKLVDPTSGDPVAGATVLIRGTTLSTTTGADGTFTLLDVPSGPQVLVVNAPNRELLSTAVDAKVGATLDLGSLASASTTFDPSQAPGPNLYSLLGRGVSQLTGAATLGEARKAVEDTITLLGGNEAGVLDEFGNQLNPAVQCAEPPCYGKTSLGHNGVEAYARRLAMGESVSLLDVFLDLAFGLQWSGGAPPTFRTMLTALQTAVDRAWQDPNGESSRLLVLLFNPGRALSPNPPVLSADTRLNRFQAYLLVNSLLTTAYSHRNEWLPSAPANQASRGPRAAPADPPGLYTSTWEGLLTSFGGQPVGPSPSSGTGKTLPGFEDLLKKYYLDQSEEALTQAKQLLKDNFPNQWPELEANAFKKSPYNVEKALDQLVDIWVSGGTAIRDQVKAVVISGQVNLRSTMTLEKGPVNNQYFGQQYLPSDEIALRVVAKSMAPNAPYIASVEDASATLAGEYEVTVPAVKVSFYPSGSDQQKDNPANVTFVYRLWRVDEGSTKYVPRVGPGSGTEKTATADLTLVASGTLGDVDGLLRPKPLAPRQDDDATAKAAGRYMFKLPFPPPGMNHYSVDCVRYAGNKDKIKDFTESETENFLKPWLAGYLDDPVTFDPLGGLERRKLFPGQGTLHELNYEVSHLSNVGVVDIAGTGAGLSRFARVDLAADRKDSAKVYVSIPGFRKAGDGPQSTGSLFRYDAKTSELTEWTRPGFKAPGQVGLALDDQFNLYTENAASEDALGGRVFRILGYRSQGDGAYKPTHPSPGARDKDGKDISTEGTPAARQFVGSLNYYSQLIQRANPAACQQLALGPSPQVNDQLLFAADSQAQEIKTIHAQAPEWLNGWDPWRNAGQRWAWNKPEKQGDPAPTEADSLAFGPLTDLAFDTAKKKLFISQGPYVVQTTGGEGGVTSVTTGGTLFTSTAGLDVCETNGEEVLFVSDRNPGGDSGRLLRIPVREIPVAVPADSAQRDLLIRRYTFLDGLDRPGQVRVTDDNQGMIVVENGGVKYVRFGFIGQALDAENQPLIGAAVTITTQNGPKTTTTDSRGVFNFTGEGLEPVVLATVTHPSGTYTERITQLGKCHSNLKPGPCVLITEPADGAVLTGGTVTVRGTVLPKNVSFAQSGGRLEVTRASGATESLPLQFTGNDNDFVVNGVTLSPGDNRLVAYANPAGSFEAGGSLTTLVRGASDPPTAQAVSGATTPGARVTVSVDGAAVAEVDADGCGYYNAQNLPLGAVSVEVKP